MSLTRRDFLSCAAAAAALMPARAGASGAVALRAGTASQQLAPDGFPATPIWGYDGGAPGPVIRVPQGGRVRRQLVNALPQPTTVHWHGIRIDNAMDGVPGLTQDAVPPGGTFDYDFTVPDAGTYWYHSHNQTMEQVARGLHGMLVVDEPEPPLVDHDLPLVLDDWLLDPDSAEIAAGFDGFHDLSHAGRLGNLVTVNGRFDPALRMRRHDRLRLRLLNAANARVFEVGLDGLTGWLVALDGMPLDAPVPVTGAFRLAPAQRADLIVDVTAEPGQVASLLSLEPNGGFGIARFPVAGQANAMPRAVPVPLPPNPMPAIENPAALPLHTMTMTGGAMRWLSDAVIDGQKIDGRALAQQGKFWALNGVVDRAKAPFLDAARGDALRLAFVNQSMFPHAMHLHGQHFRTLAEDGGLGPWRDTVLVAPGETRQVALVAENPGSWLLHCHMLGHAKAGMMSWIRVSA